MEQKQIRKVICIGSNCIAADMTAALGIRVPSPVDNISGFNIWKSHFLFDGGIKKLLFKYPYEKRDATEAEKNKWHYWDKVFKFKRGFYIVHNDFENKDFQKSIKRRIRNFKKYYRQSKKDDTLWYIYSLNLDDANLTAEYMEQLIPSLPECCRERLNCIGMRGKNPLFRDYFKYYVEFDDEDDYRWHDRNQILSILSVLEKSCGVKFITEEGGAAV